MKTKIQSIVLLLMITAIAANLSCKKNKWLAERQRSK